MAQSTEDVAAHPLDAFNHGSSLSSASGETSFEEILDSSTPRQSLAVAQPSSAIEEAVSDDHALGENQGLGRPSHDNEEPGPPPYSLEWAREIDPRGNGEGPSGSKREVSRWSPTSSSTAAVDSPPFMEDDTTEIEGLPESTIPDTLPAASNQRKERGARAQEAKSFWSRAKALRKRATTLMRDIAFYGVFGLPARDSAYSNAEVTRGVPVTEVQLRQYQATFDRPNPPAPASVQHVAPRPHIVQPEEQELEQPVEGGPRVTRTSKVKKLGARLMTAMKKALKK